MNLKHLAIGAAAVTLLAACSSTKPAATGAAQPTAPVVNQSANTGSAAPSTVDPLKDPNSPLSKRSVYFDYDSSVVKNDYKGLVDAHAAYLKEHANRHVQVQGNTDARGSREYNLGLGQRRAEAVKKSFEVLGVKDAQLEAISYGKEHPRATGSNEADFAENRRADISYDGE